MAKSKKTLIQRIALEGGDAIREELKAIGEAGEKAFAALKKAADDTAAANTGINKFLSGAKEHMSEVKRGAGEVAEGFGLLGEAVAGTVARIGTLQAAAAAVGGAVLLLSTNASKAAESIETSSQAAGLATDAYQRLKYTFEQNGSSAGALDIVMRRLNQNIEAASRGVGESSRIFQQLGVSVTDASGRVRSGEAIFQDVAEALTRLPDGATKSAIALQLFGRSGSDMVRVLALGKQGLIEYGQEAERLGVVLSQDLIQAGVAFNTSLGELRASIVGLKNELGLIAAPLFIEAFDTLTEIIVANRDEIVEWARDLAETVAPILRDFFSLLRGDEAAVENTWLIDLRNVASDLIAVFNVLSGVVKTLFGLIADILGPFVALFNMIFGTNVSPEQAVLLLVLGQLLGVFRLVGVAVQGTIAIIRGLGIIFGETARQIGIVIASALTMNGVFQTVAELIVGALGKLIEPFAIFVNWILDGIKALLAFFGFIAENVPGAVDNVDEVKQSIANTNAELEGVGKDKGPQAVRALNQIGGTKSGIDDVSKSLKTMGDEGESAYKRINAHVTQLQNNMEGLIARMQLATSAANELYDALEAAGGSSGSFQTLSGGGADSIQTLATGGHVRGPGTGTSDSILARLSNGEFVIRAAAVRKFGAGFFASLNAGRMPKFNMEGLVEGFTRSLVHLPRFADGGIVEGRNTEALRPVSISFAGDVIEGLLAPEGVAQKLVSYATTRSVRAAGKKPSWRQ